MDSKELRKALEESYDFFIQHNGQANVTEGWKISIQGNTLDDAEYLYENLIPLLVVTKASFKFATKRLIEYGHPQQSHKILTIYIPNKVDAESFCALVLLNIGDYTGGDNVAPPTSYKHYANAIYFRNDRDENGEYISAN